MTKLLKIEPGKVQVAFNDLPTAAWFDVIAVHGFQLTLRETGTTADGQAWGECYSDTSLVKQTRPVLSVTATTMPHISMPEGTLAPVIQRIELSVLAKAERAYAALETEIETLRNNDQLLMASHLTNALIELNPESLARLYDALKQA